jgi:hypothetical protein
MMSHPPTATRFLGLLPAAAILASACSGWVVPPDPRPAASDDGVAVTEASPPPPIVSDAPPIERPWSSSNRSRI